MEEDRRKKKNKKKKNKQATILTESVTVHAGETISDNQSHVPEIGQDRAAQVSRNTDASNDVGRKIDADRVDHLCNGIEETQIAKAEKQYWLDREASCQEKIKQLQAEKDAQIQKEAILELKIRELLTENDEILQKLACQEEIIKQLSDDKIASTQKEASLKVKLEQLEKEKDALIHKEDSLEDIIKQLQMEKGVYLQTENSSKELIADLNSDNTKLLAQVMELEELRKSLLEEKQELIETISSLRLQINNLGSTVTFPHFNMDNKPPEDGNGGNRVEIARALVEKLVPENAGLVEMGSDPGAVAARFADVTDSSDFTHNFTFGAEANKILPASSSNQSLEEVMVEDGRNNEHVNDKDGYRLPNSSGDIIKTDEIVRIPLNENEVEDTNLEVAAQNDENTDVPFTEAPLIGAPFRLISFVTRYISGADLVNKNTGNSGQ